MDLTIDIVDAIEILPSDTIDAAPRLQEPEFRGRCSARRALLDLPA
jgi:hypothetical protein